MILVCFLRLESTQDITFRMRIVAIWGRIVGISVQNGTSMDNPAHPALLIENLGYQHGFVYYNGAMYDLNSMLPARANAWAINEGVSINDAGKRAALATHKGGTETSVILTPNEILP